MRLLVARLLVASVLAGPCLAGCANRGMLAPSETTGTGGGSGGTAALGGSGGNATGGKGGATGGTGAGGVAGSTGKGGGSGGSNVDASCSLVTDALVDHSTTVCNAMFNFEGTGNLEGATLLSGTQAFTGVSQAATPHTYCGTGSLAIAATFIGTGGNTSRGVVNIPLGVDGGYINLAGKTLTVHVAASPAACGEDLRFKVILDTTTGSPVVLSINALTSNFTTASALLGTDAGAQTSNSLSIEAFSVSGYTGTIYVDEIDIR
jgi:hypothetical protein